MRKIKKSYAYTMLVAALLMTFLLFSAVTVHAAEKKKVTFYANGKVIKTVTVDKGKTVKIIPAPKKSGYTAIGWDIAATANEKHYSNDSNIKVTKNLKLYVIYRKNYTVQYYYVKDGKTTKYYREDIIRKYGTLKLPNVGKMTGYTKSKWYTIKNGKKLYYSEASKLKIYGNIKFYIEYNKGTMLEYYNSAGSVEKTIFTKKNTYCELIALPNTLDKTFMGWSLSSKAKFPCTVYEAGTKFKVTKNTKLYPVYFNRSSEKNITAKNITTLKKYKNLIIVGDSRSYHQELVLQKEKFDYKGAGISYVSKSGGTLDWFKETGYDLLMTELSKKNGSIAIVFNLGVNDMNVSGGTTAYIQYLNKIAPELKKRGATLFFMSANPVNGAQIDAYIEKGYGLMKRKESKLRSFNETVKNGIIKNYKYIDCYSELMKTGYSTFRYPSTTIDDGLHYGDRTYKRILDFLIKSVNK